MFREMTYCTVFKDGEFWSCDTVPEGHRPGESPDGVFRHVEGIHLPAGHVVAFGLARGRMTDLYPTLRPCGHGPGVTEAVAP